MSVLRESLCDTPVLTEADVVVVGGGPAGIMAAISAARVGASTALIERYGFLGGMATAALVGPITAVIHRYGGGRIVGGVPWEFVKALHAEGGAMLPPEQPSEAEADDETGHDGEYERSRLGDIPFDPEAFKLIADRMTSAVGVKLFLHTLGVSPVVEDTSVSALVVENRRGRAAVRCKVLIDTSGDAELAVRAGAGWQQGNGSDASVQPMTLMFRLSGVDTDSLGNLASPYISKDIRREAKQLADIGEIPVFGGPWTFWGSTFRPGEVMVNMVRLWGDATDPETLTANELAGREHMHRFVRFLRERFPAFVHARLMDSGPQIGIRETRRIDGVYQLRGEDVQSSREFDDAVALGGHVIDIHSPSGTCGQIRRRVAPYQIPLRSLIPRNLDNVLVAGRPISAEHEAHASLRVMGTCMATGQAAGVCGALSAQRGLAPSELPFQDVAAALDDLGALRLEGIRDWRAIP